MTLQSTSSFRGCSTNKNVKYAHGKVVGFLQKESSVSKIKYEIIGLKTKRGDQYLSRKFRTISPPSSKNSSRKRDTLYRFHSRAECFEGHCRRHPSIASVSSMVRFVGQKGYVDDIPKYSRTQVSLSSLHVIYLPHHTIPLTTNASSSSSPPPPRTAITTVSKPDLPGD